jgi:hypothetical protein
MTGDSARSDRRRSGGAALGLLRPGLLVMLIGAAGAGLLRWLDNLWPSQPERVLSVGALLAVTGVIVSVGAYLVLWRNAAVPGRAGLIALAAVGASLVTFYAVWVSHYVEFPADILIWSEGDFVNDIVKFRAGYPIYTVPENNDSFHYTPGSQLLTYALARAFGAADSIPVYRVLQIGYSLTAAAIAVCCYSRLLELSGMNRSPRDRALWGAVALPFFFLISTNSISNPFAHNLHIDSLAQLITVAAYWLAVDYALTRRHLTLAMMALIPSLGFFVKQSLAIWLPLYVAYLLFFEWRRSAPRVVGFAVVASALLAFLLAGCCRLWGQPFWYWTVREMATHAVSPLRSFQHLLDAWMYYGAGLFGGLVLLRGTRIRRLAGLWVVWFAYMLSLTYTSGIEWMLNHMGPGCLLAGVWFLAAVTRLWSADRLLSGVPRLSSRAWMRSGFAAGLVLLAYPGLGLVWMPVKPLPTDAYRYVEEIEREFAGMPAGKVLLDVGTWIPARNLIVNKDQAPSIASRGSSRAKGDFSGILRRLDQRYYEKILVRNLDGAAFWYDDRTWWRQSSGIRQALFANYQEVGRIKAVEGERRFLLFSFEPVPFTATRYGFKEITILAPKPVAQLDHAHAFSEALDEVRTSIR